VGLPPIRVAYLVMAKIPRFYLPKEQFHDNKATLTPWVQQHAMKTLRLREGDRLILFDGTGIEYETVIVTENQTYAALIEKTSPGLPEVHPKIFLYQAPIKKERWEWLLEKATELGVAAIVPLLTKFVEVDVTQNFDKKKERWENIVQSACEQSGRGFLPQILNPQSFNEAVEKARGKRILFYEGEATPLQSLMGEIAQASELSLFIGPEGGFSDEEVRLVRSREIPVVSLGTQTLRAETAAMAALSICYSLKSQ